MSYSDALVSQLYLLDYWRHNAEESEFISDQLGAAISSARALQRDVVNMISQAEEAAAGLAAFATWFAEHGVGETREVATGLVAAWDKFLEGHP